MESLPSVTLTDKLEIPIDLISIFPQALRIVTDRIFIKLVLSVKFQDHSPITGKVN